MKSCTETTLQTRSCEKFSGFHTYRASIWKTPIRYSFYPDPLKDPKNGIPRKWLHYYIGEAMGVLRGSTFWIPHRVWATGTLKEGA